MPWMISYRFRAAYRTANGINRNQPMDAIDVTTLRPEEFYLAARKKLLALDDVDYNPNVGLQRADDIEVIYSAFEIDESTYLELSGII